MNFDLTKLLDEWAYEPGKIIVRLINGDDNTQKIQIRLDLGILQMNIDNRPDGQQPHGYNSLLEYYEAKLDAARRDEPFPTEDQTEDHEEDLNADQDRAGDEAAPPLDTPESSSPENDPGTAVGADLHDEESLEESLEKDTQFVLTREDCRLLREEAVQYYHRYVALLVLEDFDRVVRDTTRNLRLLDMCAQYALHEEDRIILEQFRPYIMMMRARALASQALRDEEPKAALLAIDEGLEMLRQFFTVHEKLELFESSNEVQMLREMRDSLIPKLPVSQKSELHERLKLAIEQENYELASILRDELRMLHE